MKVTIGMLVEGEVAVGRVIAMTNQWCIYRESKLQKDGSQMEFAEPWECIMIVQDGPDKMHSQLKEKELPDAG